ncbi:hypothetical protein, partial [Xanthomonas cannabis]|uniref:hypothetical protein n=1 Tax=Xanthomonas cannabis TaxID=1885674 RepID=UPI001F26B3E1
MTTSADMTHGVRLMMTRQILMLERGAAGVGRRHDAGALAGEHTAHCAAEHCSRSHKTCAVSSSPSGR